MEKEVDIVALDELLIDFTEDGDRTWSPEQKVQKITGKKNEW